MSDEQNIHFIYQILTEQLKRQFETARALDQKGLFLMLATVVMAAVFPFIESASTASIIIVACLLIVTMLLAVFVLYPRSWECPPKPRAFLYEQKDEIWINTVLQQCSNLVDAYEKNEKHLKKKAGLIKCWLLSLFGVVLVVSRALL